MDTGKAAHWRVVAVLIGIPTVAAFLLVGASAASLGGAASARLTAQATTGNAKSGSMTDSFAGNGDLSGRTLPTGQAWTVHRGSWRTSTNLARTSTTLTNQTVSLPWFSTPTSVQAAMTTAGTYGAGLVMHLNDAGTEGTLLRISNGGNAVRLGRLAGGAFTVWASATGSGTATWALAYRDGTYTVSRNGTTLITYAVPPEGRSAIEANTRVGLYSTSSNSSTRWAAFTVTSI